MNPRVSSVECTALVHTIGGDILLEGKATIDIDTWNTVTIRLSSESIRTIQECAMRDYNVLARKMQS